MIATNPITDHLNQSFAFEITSSFQVLTAKIIQEKTIQKTAAIQK